MNDQATYFQKMIKCGKQRCKKCRATGEGHGPYWFLRQKVGNRTVEKYIGPHLPPTLQQVGRRPQNPLIGREQELIRLYACFERIEAQQRATNRKQVSVLPKGIQHCFLLEGEAGMGKTRLAEEAARVVAGRKWTVVWSSAYAEERAFLYRPWIEILQKLVAQDIWQQQEHNPPLQYYHYLRSLLPGSLFPETDEPVPLQQEPFKVWEAVRELLVAFSHASPLLIVLDDLHWADPESCELLAYLTRHLLNSPVMIIGTCRGTELTINHPLQKLLSDLQHENAIELLPLSPLADTQIRTLLTYLLPGADRVIRHIEKYAAGNPFFAEELTHTIKSKGTNEMTLLPLPRTVSSLLDQRLQRISPLCLALLGKAAVLGNSFELKILLALSKDQSEDQVIHLLEEALEAGILTEEEREGSVIYRFWHPLLISHLYGQLSAARRASVHRHAAEVFSRKYQGHEETCADIIMHHLIRGGSEPHSIAYYAEIAGNRAYVLSSYPTAETAYCIALESMRQCALQSDQRHLTRLMELLGECARYQGKYEEARQWYQEALEVSIAMPLAALAQEHQQEIQRRALLWCEIGFTWYSAGELAKARDCYQQGEQILAHEKIVDAAWSYLRYRQSYLYWREGNYAEALPRALEALDCFESDDQGKLMKTNPFSPVTLIEQTLARYPLGLGRIHLLLGLITNGSGQYASTIDHWNTALALFEQYESKRDIAVISCNLGDVHLRSANHTSAQVALERALTIAEQIGERPLVGAVCGNLGILALRLGKLSIAEEWLRKGMTYAQEAKDQVYLSILHAHLAETFKEQGNYTDAGEQVYCCLSISRAMSIQPVFGLALVTLGKLHYTQALAMHVAEELSPDRREHNTLHFLLRAKRALQHALALGEIEEETRTEAHIILAQVLFLLGEKNVAKELATQALEEALRFELTWLIALASRMLGTMHSGHPEYFEEALRLFNKAGMRLEYARTLQSYAEILSEQQENIQRGRRYLEEAAQIVKDEKADLDRRLIIRMKTFF